MTKTMDTRMHQDNYEFPTKIGKEDRSNLSLCHRVMKMSGAGVFFRAGQDLCPQFLYPDTGLGGTQQQLVETQTLLQSCQSLCPFVSGKLSAFVPTTRKLRPMPLREATSCWSLACDGILLSTRQMQRTRLARSSR